MISQYRSQTVGGAARSSRDFEVVLHVGHVKTASTWLKETVFGNPASGFIIPWDNAGGRAINAFVTVNSYCDDSAWARTFFEKGLRRYAGGSEIPIISEENLCGDPVGRVYTGRYVADRLHAAFPKAKVLIGIREQKSLAKSLYREYLSANGTFPLDVFLGRGDEPLGFSPILHPDYLEYDRVVAHYQKLYGRKNVLVLPIESLISDPQEYVKSIFDFCQCSGRIDQPAGAKRVGLQARVLAVRRKLNLWIQIKPTASFPSTRAQRAVIKLSNVVDRLIPKSWSVPLEHRWQEIVARRYEGVFRDSNRRLAELTGIDLAALGYDH